jgi:hypothetical protein
LREQYCHLYTPAVSNVLTDLDMGNEACLEIHPAVNYDDFLTMGCRGKDAVCRITNGPVRGSLQFRKRKSRKMNRPRPLTAISHAMAELSTLACKDVNTPRFAEWKRFTTQALLDTFGPDAPELAEFQAIDFAPPQGVPAEEAEAIWRTGKNCALALLTSIRFQSYL